MANTVSKELDAIASYVKKHAPAAKKAIHHQHGGESVRTADYKGHHIIVRTTYDITVDGKPVTGHIALTNDGRLHYHPVPNASFDSAIDLVKNLIDVFPEDFTASAVRGAAAHGDHSDHGDHGDHMHMMMAAPAKKAKRGKAKRARRGK